jgi:uroporphyrinogen-III synthase
MRLLVTRPDPEATDLCLDLASRGIDAIHCPMISTRYLDTVPWPGQLDPYQLVILVSKPSVRAFVRQALPLPAHCALYAIGPYTGQALVEAGYPARWPEQHNNAEALIRCLEPVHTGGRCLLVRGGAGRPVLTDWLSARGPLDMLDVYERGPAVLSAEEIAAIRAQPVSHVLVSSGVILDRLLATFGKAWLGKRTLILFGKRLVGLAHAQGLTNVHNTAGVDGRTLSALMTATSAAPGTNTSKERPEADG